MCQEELRVILDDVAMGQARTSHTSHQDEAEGPMGAEEFQDSNEEMERVQSLLERVQATRVKST